jgi:hypothetical protein
VKRSKSARRTFRKVWEKLRALASSNSATSSGAAASGSGGDEDDGTSDNVFEDPIKPSVALVSPTPSPSRIEVKHESCIRKLNLLILLILNRLVHWMLTRMNWRSLPRAMLKTIECSLLERHLKMITKRGKLWLNMHMPRK